MGGREIRILAAKRERLNDGNSKMRRIVRGAVKVRRNGRGVVIFNVMKVLGQAFFARKAGFANIKGRSVGTESAVDAVNNIGRVTRSILENNEFTIRGVSLYGGCRINKRTKRAAVARIAA